MPQAGTRYIVPCPSRAAEIRIRAERRLGELMAEQRDAGLLSKGRAEKGIPHAGSDETRVEKPITLAEIGVDKSLADRARRLAAIPAPSVDSSGTMAEILTVA